MLILGMTVLKHRLQLQAFLYYWLICMLVTALTLVIALLDLRAVRLRSPLRTSRINEPHPAGNRANQKKKRPA